MITCPGQYRMEGSTYMYHVECIDIHKAEGMYLYIDRACLCANNMYNAANFHIRNLMTGLKKDISLRTENEKSVIRTFAGSICRIHPCGQLLPQGEALRKDLQDLHGQASFRIRTQD